MSFEMFLNVMEGWNASSYEATANNIAARAGLSPQQVKELLTPEYFDDINKGLNPTEAHIPPKNLTRSEIEDLVGKKVAAKVKDAKLQRRWSRSKTWLVGIAAITLTIGAALVWMNWKDPVKDAGDSIKKGVLTLMILPGKTADTLMPGVDGSNPYKILFGEELKDVTVFDGYNTQYPPNAWNNPYSGYIGNIGWRAGGCHEHYAEALFKNYKGESERIRIPPKDPTGLLDDMVHSRVHRHVYQFVTPFAEWFKVRFANQPETFNRDIGKALFTWAPKADYDPQYGVSQPKAYIYDGLISSLDCLIKEPGEQRCPLDPTPHYIPNPKNTPKLLAEMLSEVSAINKAVVTMTFPKTGVFSILWYTTPSDQVQGWGGLEYHTVFPLGLPIGPQILWNIAPLASAGSPVKLSGTVKDSAGKAVEGVEVTVDYDLPLAGATPAPGTPASAKAITDRSGKFEAEVTFASAGFHTATASCEVQEGDTKKPVKSLPLIISVFDRMLRFVDLDSEPCCVLEEGDSVTMTGRVTDFITHDSVEGVEVGLIESTPVSKGVVTTPSPSLTDKDGKFSLTFIPDAKPTGDVPITTGFQPVIRGKGMFGTSVTGPTRYFFAFPKGTELWLSPVDDKAFNNKTLLDAYLCERSGGGITIGEVIVKGVKDAGTWAQQNPGATAAIVGGAAAGFTGLYFWLRERKKKKGGK